MNSLPFFPPPSRALSRLNDRAPPSSNLSRTSTQNAHKPQQTSNVSRASPNRGGTVPSSPSSTSEGNGERPSSASRSGMNGERSTARRATVMGTSSTPESNRSPQLSDDLGSSKRPSSSGTSTPAAGGRLGTRLPHGMYFDLLRASEVSAAFRLEVKGYSQEDGASLDTLRYRQKEAPHLFFGAYLPMAPPKVSGPLTISGPSQRKLIAYACGTAASALTARSMKIHSNDEDAWLVCLHSVCVAPEYQRRGVALKLIEEFMKRLRKAESGQGGPDMQKKGYECVALLAHEELFPLYIKAGFSVLGVSHVNWGSGGWFEMRRYINSDRQEQQEEGKPLKRSSSSSALIDGVTKALSPALLPIETQPIHKVVSSVEMVASPDSEKMSPLSHFKDVQVSDQKSHEVEIRKDSVSSSSENSAVGAAGLAGFSSAQILEALKKQSTPVKSNDEGPRNPGTAYATIVGQTLAAKTTVEDAFFALEARLVDRETCTNLADIYCPREECACLLLKAKEADWEVAEVGPVSPSLHYDRDFY
jgi:GNAT superfamily N-acetyltransferase